MHLIGKVFRKQSKNWLKVPNSVCGKLHCKSVFVVVSPTVEHVNKASNEVEKYMEFDAFFHSKL